MSLQCLVEAVSVLDVLCRQDPSFLYRTLSCLKALHRRLGEDPGSERALVPLAQFFLSCFTLTQFIVFYTFFGFLPESSCPGSHWQKLQTARGEGGC